MFWAIGGTATMTFQATVTGAVVGDVRIAAHVNQSAELIEDRQNRVGTRQTVGVIDVEQRRHMLEAVVGRCVKLDLHFVEIDIVQLIDDARDA